MPTAVRGRRSNTDGGLPGVHFSPIPKGQIENSLIIDAAKTANMGFSKRDKPMSTASTTAASSTPSANPAIIRVGLIGVRERARGSSVGAVGVNPGFDVISDISSRA